MQPMIVIMNFSYAIGGGLITLVFMYFGYKWLDLLTPFDTGEELSKGESCCGARWSAASSSVLELQSAWFIGLGLN
jgi:hypothetical protein